MKKFKLVVTLFIATVLVSCGSTSTPESNENTNQQEVTNISALNMENLLVEIKKREAAFKGTKNATGREGLALMEAYADFSDRFRNREFADEYLFKAGEIAMGANLTADAIRHLNRLYNEFPHYKNRAYGLFLLAFVYENQAGNLDEAKRLYGEFLNEFPTHDMADDARASIANLGKSPEEIIRDFERKDSIAKAQKAA